MISEPTETREMVLAQFPNEALIHLGTRGSSSSNHQGNHYVGIMQRYFLSIVDIVDIKAG